MALILMFIAHPSFSLLYILDEVISPTMTIKAVGFFLGGLTLYILNKMKDTIFNGQKNNKYYHNIINKNYSITSYAPFAKHTRILHKINFPCFSLNQQRYFLINRIRAMNRIGPHNEDVLSVVVGSLLGDGHANNRSGEGVRICYRQSIIHKEYLFWLYDFFYSRGYASNLEPRLYTRTIKNKEKLYYGYEFNTFTFRSFS